MCKKLLKNFEMYWFNFYVLLFEKCNNSEILLFVHILFAIGLTVLRWA